MFFFVFAARENKPSPMLSISVMNDQDLYFKRYFYK